VRCQTAVMELGLWLAFVGAAFAISVSPGAGAIFSMANGLNVGVRRSYWGIVGLEIGLMTQLALVAIGLGAILAGSAIGFTVIKWLGVAYLVYLAVQQWRNAGIDLNAQVGASAQAGRGALVLRGALVNLTNPKGLVFLLAVLPQFVVPTDPLLPQYVVIGATMIIADLIVMGGYAGLAGRLHQWLRTPRQQIRLSRTFSGLFAVAAVGLSLVRRSATI
jgi:homoserine/homoserine lactone efflux protein